jgi:predicted phage terminase large subunit-like protein
MQSLKPSLALRARAELELRARRRQREAEARSGFARYLPLVSPPGWAYTSAHFQRITEALDKVTRGEIDRLAIWMPPRHGKTETVSVRYPVYRIERDPTMRVLITGYSERFARRLGRKTRNIAHTRVGIVHDKGAADEWDTTQGGGVMTRGVGAPPTGVGFNLICVDDPIKKREDAESEVFREKLWDWYTDDIYTRLEPGGAIVMTLTRWHHDDVAARAIASEKDRWHILSLPAISDDGRALWPERYNIESLERIREVMNQNEGLASWESLYQQNASPREGAFFKVNNLEIVEALPAGLLSCRAWDLAATASGGDWTAGVKIGTRDGVWFIEDVRRGQWATDERNAVMRQCAALDGPQCRIRLAEDPGQAGKDQSQSMLRMLAGYSVKVERVTGAKTTRADALSAQVNVGNVKMLRGAWNTAFIEELRQFPFGKFDDQVDATADAFTEMAMLRVWQVSG